MVSLDPGAHDIVGPEGTVYVIGSGLIVARTVLEPSGVYLNVVLGSEVGIAAKVAEELATLASEAKRTEDRGIFKAKRTAP